MSCGPWRRWATVPRLQKRVRCSGRLYLVLSDAPSKLTERYAGRCLWAYRAAKTPALFDRVCGKCVNDIAHWTPSAVALLIRAVADAGVAQDKVADACSRHVTDRREAYGASSLVDAAWGLACYGGARTPLLRL